MPVTSFRSDCHANSDLSSPLLDRETDDSIESDSREYAWVAGREEQWRGIVYSDVIIAAGFATFVLSDFPPTQRFGMVVVLGTIIDILANFFPLPANELEIDEFTNRRKVRSVACNDGGTNTPRG